MNTPDDPALRELLRETIRDEEDDAPPFERMWSAASASHHRPQVPIRLVRWTAVAAMLVIGVWVAFRTSSAAGSLLHDSALAECHFAQ